MTQMKTMNDNKVQMMVVWTTTNRDDVTTYDLQAKTHGVLTRDTASDIPTTKYIKSFETRARSENVSHDD
jgi:hypothetical protein